MANTKIDGNIVGIEAEVDGVQFYSSSASTIQPEPEQVEKEDCLKIEATPQVLDRGDITVGVTIKIPYPPVDKVYFTPSFNVAGQLVEVFINISKQSPVDSAVVSALARSISTGLKYNAPVDKFIKHFKGLDSGQPVLVKFPGQKKSKFIKSIPDLIGHALEYYGTLEKVQKALQETAGVVPMMFGGSEKSEEENPNVVQPTRTHEENPNAVKQTLTTPVQPEFTTLESAYVDPASICPECGEVMTNEAGCWTCYSCGYSKCG